jgi:hypothetical protein
VEWELAGETEVLGEKLPLCPPQISHDLTRAAAVRKPATNRLSYGAAYISLRVLSFLNPIACPQFSFAVTRKLSAENDSFQR